MFSSNFSDTFNMDIYDRIKDLCKKEGVTVKAMLEGQGIVYSSYYSSQQAKRFPGLPDLVSIANHFNVSLDFLVSGKDKNKLPDDLYLLMSELETLDEKQKSFLVSTLRYQISLFKRLDENITEY